MLISSRRLGFLATKIIESTSVEATNVPTMTSIAALNLLLEKTSDWDKDERYMATNDLCTALSKDIKIDENMEQRICAAVLKQLGNPHI